MIKEVTEQKIKSDQFAEKVFGCLEEVKTVNIAYDQVNQ